jgi:hypothetical protein
MLPPSLPGWGKFKKSPLLGKIEILDKIIKKNLFLRGKSRNFSLRGTDTNVHRVTYTGRNPGFARRRNALMWGRGASFGESGVGDRVSFLLQVT